MGTVLNKLLRISPELFSVFCFSINTSIDAREQSHDLKWKIAEAGQREVYYIQIAWHMSNNILFPCTAAGRSDTGAERRLQDIVARRKLVDLAKAQAQEVAVLRAEVERLRMRTFPALVQIEH